MNTQTKWIIGLVVTLSLVVGILIGGLFNRNEKGVEMVHKMPDGTIMANSGDMSSMMHDMNASLEGKTGDSFDREFLVQMVIHHEGAVDMAKKVLEVSRRPELITLANDIISAQNREIKMMNNWKIEWFK